MNYISLTIGPLSETMSYCQKTRELWVGSYFFSYFMRTLIGNLMDEKINILIPYVDDKKEILTKYMEEGVFHDRFIASSDQNKEEIKTILNTSINDTFEDINKLINQECQKNLDALKNYIQYSYIIATEDELLNATGKENIVFALDAILDSMELEQKFELENKTKVCKIDQKDNPQKIDWLVTPLAKLQYEAKEMKDILINTNFGFKSIPEIAIADLVTKIENSDTNEYKKALATLRENEKKFWEENAQQNAYDNFYETIKSFKDFKPHHKYYAVIYADGDNMGNTIRSIYQGENKDLKIKDLSKKIYEFITGDKENQKSSEKSLYNEFEEFGGMLIYAGGDDILAFAPIFGRASTIFELLEKLSKRFTSHLQSNVSLSFGVSINYYKSPMIEAINHALSLLYEAKDYNTEEKRGSLAISLTKHSGQSYKGVFYLNDDLYNSYKKLFKDELGENAKLPHNIQYSLKNYEELFLDIFQNYKNVSNQKIDAVFENLIKDESHTQKAKDGLDELKEYIKNFKPLSTDEYKKLLSQLAIIKFLRGDR